MATQKVVKKGEATPIIANTQKASKIVEGEKKSTSIAGAIQQRLLNLEKREKRLVEIVKKRTAYLAKLQANLDTFKAALVKVKEQKAAELKAIKELTETINNGSKA
jgi:hypothetical protein